jgi:hypothetical protein
MHHVEWVSLPWRWLECRVPPAAHRERRTAGRIASPETVVLENVNNLGFQKSRGPGLLNQGFQSKLQKVKMLRKKEGALKGTVSQDFRLLVFFMNQVPPSPGVYHQGRFDFFRKFAEIFAAQGLPPVSMTPVANAKNLQS